MRDWGWSCEGFVAPGNIVLPLLGHLLASFWLSWDAFWPHFGSLGAPLGLILRLLKHPGTPFWPNLAHVGPTWRKKLAFLSLSCGSWLKLGGRNPEKSMSKTMFLQDAFSTSIFIDFSSLWDSENRCFFDGFWNLRRKRRFCQNYSFPMENHCF